MLQPIEALQGTEKFLKVPLRGTFKNFSGFYKSAKRCKHKKLSLRRTAPQRLIFHWEGSKKSLTKQGF